MAPKSAIAKAKAKLDKAEDAYCAVMASELKKGSSEAGKAMAAWRRDNSDNIIIEKPKGKGK
jgi:hypothetical protein